MNNSTQSLLDVMVKVFVIHNTEMLSPKDYLRKYTDMEISASIVGNELTGDDRAEAIVMIMPAVNAYRVRTAQAAILADQENIVPTTSPALYVQEYNHGMPTVEAGDSVDQAKPDTEAEEPSLFEQMKQRLVSRFAIYYVDGVDMGDVYEAIYWFASDNYNGQNSELYEVICHIQDYTPSPLAHGVTKGSIASGMYKELCNKYSAYMA